VVAVGGLIASGKSTLADALAERLSAPVVDADRTRKRMVGAGFTEALRTAAFEGPYDPGTTSSVYAELMRRAAIVVASGRPVVVDASFRSREMRLAAREMAHAANVPFLFVECRAPVDVCLARLERREREGTTVSDGRRSIFADFAARFEPIAELDAAEHVVIDTTAALDENVRKLDGRLRTWPHGLVA
jgi:predicted kinase